MIITPTQIASFFPGTAADPLSEWSRVEQGVKRLMILDERFDDLLGAYIIDRVGPRRAEIMGRPDTSNNPMLSFCRAVSTPGCYGTAPTLSGGGVEALSGIMRRAGVWPKKQHVQFVAAGMGSCALYVDWPESLGYLTVEPVPHCYLWAEAHPDDPQRAVVMRRLVLDDEGHPFWREWDLRDPDAPSYRVVEAKGAGELGETLGETLTGDAYPWRDVDGAPLLPWVILRHRDDGTMWSWQAGRGAVRGSLRVGLLSTLADGVALFASSNAVVVAGMKPIAQNVRQGVDGQVVLDYQLEPGAVVYHETEEGQTPFVRELGPGQDLMDLAGYTQRIAAQTMVEQGITPPEAVRVGANPQSGEALSMTRDQQRYEQERVIPLCLEADRETIRIVAGLALAYGGVTERVDAGEVGIVYRPIPTSPNAQRAEREKREWELQNGLISRVDLYLEQHPGVSRETAIAELRRIQAEERALMAAEPEPPAPAAPSPAPRATPMQEQP